MTTVAKPANVSTDAAAHLVGDGFALVGPLRIDLKALGIDTESPEFAERFFRMANENEPYSFEFSSSGELIVMAPSGWESNIGESGVNAALFHWTLHNDGYASSQTVAFQLPSGAIYIPDAAWINQERYNALRSSEYASIIPGAPDFVVEVRSRTDTVAQGLSKMQEWIDGGARLGWYIDPYQRKVHVFRAEQPTEILDDPETLSGEGVLQDFVFEIRRLVFDRYAESGDSGD